MVIINTPEDIIRAMDDNPEWLEAVRQRVLTRELMELPDKFARLSETVAELSETVAELSETVAELSDKLAKLSDEFAQFAETTNRRLYGLEKNVAELTGHVDSMRGDHLEMRLQGRIHSLLGRRGLYRARIVRASFPAGTSPQFTDRSEDAVLDGVITPEQHERLMETDLIVRARRGRDSDQSVYVAIEVANRLDDDDVSRVTDTGVALSRMFPHAEVLTAVYGRSISEAYRLFAQSKGVDIFLTRDRR